MAIQDFFTKLQSKRTAFTLFFMVSLVLKGPEELGTALQMLSPGLSRREGSILSTR